MPRCLILGILSNDFGQEGFLRPLVRAQYPKATCPEVSFRGIGCSNDQEEGTSASSKWRFVRQGRSEETLCGNSRKRREQIN